MRWAFGLLLVGLAVELGLGGDADADRKKFEGDWQIVEATKAGNKLPTEKARQMTFHFSADSVSYTTPEGKQKPVPYKIDPSKSPKQFNLLLPEVEGGLPGIYRFDGDQLTIVLGEPGQRPSEFALPEKGHYLKLKREKR